jgi:hypothetical protein
MRRGGGSRSKNQIKSQLKVQATTKSGEWERKRRRRRKYKMWVNWEGEVEVKWTDVGARIEGKTWVQGDGNVDWAVHICQYQERTRERKEGYRDRTR